MPSKKPGIDEAHYAYDEPDYRTEFAPLKQADSVRVYHGYRDLSDAVSAAKYGLSGKTRADRVYSYERDNNPYGLFVTLSRKVATQFASAATHDQVIMEFNANVADLEAPVWPGGSYTVPGQMSQYFGHGAKGTAARRQAQRDAEATAAETYSGSPHVAQSDRKHMTGVLTGGGEYQALYVGHMAPQQIVAFHVRPGGKEYHYQAPWQKLTREEFLDHYGQTKLKREDQAESRVYDPTDIFNGEEFIERMAKKYNNDVPEIDKSLRWMWRYILGSTDKVAGFTSEMGKYLWPKQMVPAMRWMKDRYGNSVSKVTESTEWNGIPGCKVWYHPATGTVLHVDVNETHENMVWNDYATFGLTAEDMQAASNSDHPNLDAPMSIAIEHGWVRIANFNDAAYGMAYFPDVDGNRGYVTALNTYLARRGLAWLAKQNLLPERMDVEIGYGQPQFGLELGEIDKFIQTGAKPR